MPGMYGGCESHLPCMGQYGECESHSPLTARGHYNDWLCCWSNLRRTSADACSSAGCLQPSLRNRRCSLVLCWACVAKPLESGAIVCSLVGRLRSSFLGTSADACSSAGRRSPRLGAGGQAFGEQRGNRSSAGCRMMNNYSAAMMVLCGEAVLREPSSSSLLLS